MLEAKTDELPRREEVCIPLSKIVVGLFQLTDLEPETVQSIAAQLQNGEYIPPILVRPTKNGKFEVIYGHHRLEAYRQVGRKTIPCIVRELSDAEGYLRSVAENLNRKNWSNPVKEGVIYENLVEGWNVCK